MQFRLRTNAYLATPLIERWRLGLEEFCGDVLAAKLGAVGDAEAPLAEAGLGIEHVNDEVLAPLHLGDK